VEEFQKRMAAAKFDFNDFLSQFERINNMGGLKMLKLMPGFNQVSEKQLYEVEKKFKMYSALISSMTPDVRLLGWGGEGRTRLERAGLVGAESAERGDVPAACCSPPG
jgi:hypothetical protein